MLISIHASARDATTVKIIAVDRPVFQSTHPRGMRPIFLQFSQTCIVFQSTHPRGMRLRSKHISKMVSIISIHASARDTTGRLDLSHILNIFQSTHPRRGCNNHTESIDKKSEMISTHSQGCDNLHKSLPANHQH